MIQKLFGIIVLFIASNCYAAKESNLDFEPEVESALKAKFHQVRPGTHINFYKLEDVVDGKPIITVCVEYKPGINDTLTGFAKGTGTNLIRQANEAVDDLILKVIANK